MSHKVKPRKQFISLAADPVEFISKVKVKRSFPSSIFVWIQKSHIFISIPFVYIKVPTVIQSKLFTVPFELQATGYE